MRGVASIPLLSQLTRVELAKLIPDMVERSLQPGQWCSDLLSAGSIHIVAEGEMELVGEGDLPLLTWREGDVIHADDLPNLAASHWRMRSVTDVKLVSIPTGKFGQLIESNPVLAAEYRHLIRNQMTTALMELCRTRELVGHYADELWRDTLPLPEDALAAALSVTPISTQPPDVPAPAPRFRWDRVVALLGTGAGVLLCVLGITGQINSAGIMLGLLIFAAANWLTGALPDFVVALAVVVSAIMLNLAQPSVALSGFISPTWFTLLAVWVIGVAVNRSGLLYRMALGMLRLLPPTYMGQSLALAITGLVTTPFLPSGHSRMVMVAPLVKELGEALQFPKNSRGMAGLAMTSLIGFGFMYFMFLNGSTLPLLAYSLLPPEVQSQISWTFWFTSALPLGLFVFVVSFIGIQKLLPPESARKLTPDIIHTQLGILGPMSKAEWLTAMVLFITLGGFALGEKMGLQPAWIAVTGMLVVISAGIVNREKLKGSVDWGFLLFFGAVLSFAGVVRHTGVDQELSMWIIPVFQYFQGSAWAFVGGVALITFLVRLVIPAVQSVPLLLIALTPVAAAVGVNPFVVSLVVLAMGTNFVIPQQSPFYMALHAGTDEAFRHQQILRVGLMHAVVIFAGLLLSVPYWRWIGLLP